LQKFFKTHGFEEDLINDFKLWQQEETIAASQAVHPSYIAWVLATSPYPADKRTFKPGALGSATLFSVRTLAQASKTIWYYSMVIPLQKRSDQNSLKNTLLKRGDS